MKTRTILSFLAIFEALAWSRPAAARADSPLQGEPAVRKKLQLRKYRVQVTPFVGMSLSQPFVHMGYLGGKVTFHFADWIGVRGTFGYGLIALESQLLRAINGGGLPEGIPPGETDPMSQIQCPPGGPPCRASEDEQNPAPLLHDSQAGLVRAQWQSSFDVVFTPFAGKLGIFSAIFTEYDFYIFGGLGLVNYAKQYPDTLSTQQQRQVDPVTGDCVIQGTGERDDECILHPVSADTGVKVGGSFGIGMNLMLTDWVAINLEVQDIVVGVNLAGLNSTVDDIPPRVDNGDRDAFHNVTFQLGAQFYFPPKAKRSK